MKLNTPFDWARTSTHLREARANVSEAAEGVCVDELKEFEEYLSQNELKLALDAVEAALEKSDDTN